MAKSPEFPFIVREDVSPEPADPKHNIYFVEELSEAERDAASLRKRTRHIYTREDVEIYVHVDHVRDILERIAEGDLDPDAAVLAFKPLS